MKKRLSRILAALLLINLLIPAAAAAGSGRFVASSAGGKAGEIVTITISMENNPGIVAAALQVHYDNSKLKLVAVDNARLIGGTATFSQNYADHPYYAGWNDALATENNTSNGVLLTLTFEILENCPAGESEISLSYREGDVFDKDYKDQPFVTVSGSVSVENETEAPAPDNGESGRKPEQQKPTQGQSNPQPVQPKPQQTPQKTAYAQYKDLAADGWYREFVEYMLNRGLMNGVDRESFEPDGYMTRAQLVTILYRAAGSPIGSGGTAYSDVKRGDWYEASVAWASRMGVVNGMGDGKFDPDGNITREQLAAILYRYSGATPDRTDHLAAFSDGHEISAYARDALNWAVGRGILSGMGDGKLSPGHTATRAQTAAMLTRYLKNASSVPVPDVLADR